MQEKRRDRRISLSSKLFIKNMSDPSAAADEVEIEVMNVSKAGVGFICSKALTIGEVYETQLKLWTDEVLHAFLKVVRLEQMEDERFSCGTIFIGLTEMNAKRIEIYDMLNEDESK